jgi:hypothetical protein
MERSLLRLLLIGFALTAQACTIAGGEGPHTETALARELSEIKAPIGATSGQHDSIFKTDHGVMGDYYKSNLTYKEIRAHYDDHLQKRGWRFMKEIAIKSWGVDYIVRVMRQPTSILPDRKNPSSVIDMRLT